MRFRRVLVLAGALLCLSATAVATADAGAEVKYRESFEVDLGGWQPDTDGRARDWLIYRTAERPFDGRYSLGYYLDGTFDDGTIWIERTFTGLPRSAVTVIGSFWLFSPDAGITTWPVVGGAFATDPETEQDLPIIGRAGRVAGWTRYEFKSWVPTDKTGTVWVAVGISATWEVRRTYHIDLVELTIT